MRNPLLRLSSSTNPNPSHPPHPSSLPSSISPIAPPSPRTRLASLDPTRHRACIWPVPERKGRSEPSLMAAEHQHPPSCPHWCGIDGELTVPVKSRRQKLPFLPRNWPNERHSIRRLLTPSTNAKANSLDESCTIPMIPVQAYSNPFAFPSRIPCASHPPSPSNEQYVS